MTSRATSPDNRRLVVRIGSHEVLDLICDLAARTGLDLIEALIHAGVWTANTEHLLESKGRYARLLDLPPDSLRRPVGETELLERLRLPRPVFEAYVERLIGRGLVERVGTGLVVPSAVFTRPEMIDGLNTCYEALGRLADTVQGLNSYDAAA